MALETDSPSAAIFRKVDNDELDGDAAISWRVHGISTYRRRIESSRAGCDQTDDTPLPGHLQDDCVSKFDAKAVVKSTISRGWLNIMFL